MAGEDHTIDALLHRLSPSPMALLEWLKPRIDDAMLQEIAQAEYGYLVDENFIQLLAIRDEQQIPAPLMWSPREVLELVRWYEPDNPSWKHEDSRETGHWMRLFSCAVLLRAADSPATFDYLLAENNTLIQLVASALRLGPEASRNALRFLCWRIICVMPEDGDDEYPFFVMAILLLSVSLFESGQDAGDLMLLADWVIAAERRARNDEGHQIASDEWLLGLTLFDQRHETLREVIREVLLDPAKGIPEPAVSALRGIAARITPNDPARQGTLS